MLFRTNNPLLTKVSIFLGYNLSPKNVIQPVLATNYRSKVIKQLELVAKA
jgi:hypothetical protein